LPASRRLLRSTFLLALRRRGCRLFNGNRAGFGLAVGCAASTILPLQVAVAAEPVPSSENSLDLSGSFRTRIESIEGQFRPNAAQDDFLASFRTTLLARYRSGPLELAAEVFDSRAYLQDANSSAGTGEVNPLDLVQAYAAMTFGGAERMHGSIKAGRFTMDLGSRRLISRPNFRNTASSFTGVLAEIDSPRAGQLHLFWTMPVIREPADRAAILDNKLEMDRESTDLQFYGASYHLPVGSRPSLEIYSYRLAERDDDNQPTRNRRLLASGIRLFAARRSGELDYDLEATRQTGRIRSSSRPNDEHDLHVSAHFVHAEVGRSFNALGAPRASVHFDYASGDDPRTGTYSRFDGLFGGRRFEFGAASLYGPLARSNIVSPGLRLEVTPDKRSDAFIMYRTLWLADRRDSFAATEVRDTRGASGRFAGHQVELRARRLLGSNLRLDGGVAYLAKGRFLDSAPNAPRTGNSLYGYLDATWNF
jgi:hypothetical protein